MDNLESYPSIYILLLVAFIIHSCILFLDFFFKSCSHYPYYYFLNNSGLQVKPFRVTWFTSAFNRQIQKWGTFKPRIQMAWFSAGTWVAVLIMPVSVILIVHTIISAMKSSLQDDKSFQQNLIVEPLIPGWNLPVSDLGYYLLTLFFSSLIHELGHAMAAVREDVHLVGFSVTIFFIVPVVLTHLDQLESVSSIKQLRVTCAGVWHNIFLALIAAVVATALPWFLYPFYDFGTGVQVESITKGSSVAGPGGLMEGDKITQLNECPIRGSTSWNDCLSLALHEVNTGFCIPDSFIREHDESVPAKHMSESMIECCSNNSPRHLCFEYVGSELEPLPLPQHSCLYARKVIELSSSTCLSPSDCPTSLHCFRPSLGNSTKLIRIFRAQGPVVLFLGSPSEIFHSVQTSDFINLYSFLPSAIPDAITKLCQFITIFSSGIAVLNIIPCFYFDGQYIIRATLDVLLAAKVPLSSVRHAISLCITILGSLLLAIYIVIMLFAAT